MSGIRDRIQTVVTQCTFVVAAGLLAGPPLYAQVSASTVLAPSMLRALMQHPEAATQLPDGRWLRIESQHVILADPARSAKDRVIPLPATRIGASAVVLPDGKILIWGGTDTFGQLQPGGWWFDATTSRFAAATGTGLSPVAGQNMTVLSNGDVLVAGGRDTSTRDAERLRLWHPTLGTVTPVATTFPARLAPVAALQRDGTVALSGGFDTQGKTLGETQRFDPTTQALTTVDQVTSDATKISVASSLPVADSDNIPADTLISMRFTRPVDPKSITAATISLIGPAGPVEATVAAVQDGRLAFITPKEDLLTGTHYTVALAGVRARDGQALPFTSFGFRTTELDKAAEDSEAANSASA